MSYRCKIAHKLPLFANITNFQCLFYNVSAEPGTAQDILSLLANVPTEAEPWIVQRPGWKDGKPKLSGFQEVMLVGWLGTWWKPMGKARRSWKSRPALMILAWISWPSDAGRNWSQLKPYFYDFFYVFSAFLYSVWNFCWDLMRFDELDELVSWYHSILASRCIFRSCWCADALESQLHKKISYQKYRHISNIQKCWLIFKNMVCDWGRSLTFCWFLSRKWDSADFVDSEGLSCHNIFVNASCQGTYGCSRWMLALFSSWKPLRLRSKGDIVAWHLNYTVVQ